MSLVEFKDVSVSTTESDHPALSLRQCSDAGLMMRHVPEEGDPNQLRFTAIATVGAWDRFKEVEGIKSDHHDGKAYFLGKMIFQLLDTTRKARAKMVPGMVMETGGALGHPGRSLFFWMYVIPEANETALVFAAFEEKDEVHKALTEDNVREDLWKIVLELIAGKEEKVADPSQLPFMHSGVMN